MKTIILFLAFPMLAFAQCPPESIDVQYTSPITHRRKMTCGYMRDNVLIKHGPEIEYDKDGTAVKTTYYSNGEEGKKPQPKIEPRPGISLDEEKEALDVLNKLLSVLTYDKTGLGDGSFKVKHCDPNPKAWAIAAITKKSIPRSYSYNDNCDVSGSFTANFKEEFPVEFALRNLKDFTKTKMKVKMDLNKGKSGVVYQYKVRDGEVSSNIKSIVFDAEYEVEVDPLTGSTKFSTQGGSITLKKVGDKVVNITRPLLFNR